PTRPVRQLPILTSDECRHLACWNDTATAYPAAAITDLITAWSAVSPGGLAVVCGGRSLTYAGLAGGAARLAWYLREAGGGPETVVGVCLERGLDMVVAVLAVWLAGGAYLPLDPDYPPERLAFMLADSGATVLVSHRGHGTWLAGDRPAGRVRVIAL